MQIPLFIEREVQVNDICTIVPIHM